MEAHTSEQLLERATRVIRDCTGAESVSLTDKITDLCADSLEAASLVTELEEEFNIDIEGFGPAATLGNLLKFIEANRHVIREAALSDLEKVVALALESLELGPYKDIVKRSPEYATKLARQLITEPNGVVLISEEEGQLNGLFAFFVFPHFYSGEMTAGELIWYVTPDARPMRAFGDGVAFRLLEAGEKKALDMGAKTMQLGAPTEGVGKLYERRGYAQIEVTYRRELACQSQPA